MSRSLRVALVGPYPREEGKIVGGVEGVTSALGDGLAGRDGVEVHAVTSVAGINSPALWRSSTGVSVYGVPLFGKLGNLTAFAVEVARLRAAIHEIDPDIVHVHTQIFYARAGLKMRYPSVLTIHGIHHREAALQKGWTGLRSRFACRYDRDAIRSARHIVFINRYAAESYQPWVCADDVRYIDNPIDDRFFTVPRCEEPDRILFGGTIGHRKHPLLLLEAAARLVEKRPGIKVRIAGKVTEEDYYERCKAFVAEHKLESNIDFLGSVSIETMMEELSKSNMLVLPSNQETAPVIVSEAMAAGNAIVATPAGGTAEMVEDGKAGLIVPFNDPAALAGAIDRILADADLRAAMGEFARREAEERYKCSVVVDKTLAYYEDILQGTGDKRQ